MAYKRKYITSYFGSRKRARTYGRKRTLRRGKASFVRRRRTTFKRGGYKTKRAARYRKIAQKKPVTFTTHGTEFKVVKASHVDNFVKMTLSCSLTDCYNNENKDALDAYVKLYDEFRIKKQTWHFWLGSTNVFTDEKKDSIIEFIHVYDPDAQQRLFATRGDYTKVEGYKKRQMKPYVHYKVHLYPTWQQNIQTVATSFTSNTKSGKWMDAAAIGAAGMNSYNGQQCLFDHLNVGALVADIDTDIFGELYTTYQFRGKRNNQKYA